MDRRKNLRTGAVIIADGHLRSQGASSAMLPLGNTTVIRQIISILEQAGIKPIVLVTGEDSESLEKHVSKLPVINLYNPDYKRNEMFDSVKKGLKYVEKLCDRVLVMPAKYPMLLPDTIEKMMACGHENAVPVYNGRRGHPVMFDVQLFPKLFSYKGFQGMREAMHQPGVTEHIWELSVDDEGIILAVKGEEDVKTIGVPDKPLGVYPGVRLELKRESVFFDWESAQFLELIDHNGSMQTACKQMHISYSKGWKIVKEAERQLGFELVRTRTGGADGGSSTLTEKGRRTLTFYQKMQEKLEQEAKKLFQSDDIW